MPGEQIPNPRRVQHLNIQAPENSLLKLLKALLETVIDLQERMKKNRSEK